MSLLQFIVLITGLVFILFGVDLFKRKKMNFLHVMIFTLGGVAIALFAINQELLDRFGQFFGSARGADVLVYMALIFLFYMYIEVINKHTKDKMQLTKLISHSAIYEAYNEQKNEIEKIKNTTAKDDFIFAIRAYNEGSHIGETIDEIIKAGYHKIIVANDGSQDDTPQVVQKKQKEYGDKFILLVNHTINRGGGAANQTLFGFIKKYYKDLKVSRMVTYDADGQMSIKDMQTFHKAMQEKPAEVYLGSRFLEGAKAENITRMRRIILAISRLVTFMFYGSRVSDPHVGYRILSMKALSCINLTADGMHYANELQEQIKFTKLSYAEVPVHIIYTEYSTTKAHRQKNSNSLKLAAEMIYRKMFFR